MPPLRRQPALNLTCSFFLLPQRLLGISHGGLQVPNADLVCFLLLAQEGNLPLAGLLLHGQPVGFVVGLEQFGVEFLEVFVSVGQFLLKLLDPPDLGGLLVFQVHQPFAHFTHFGLERVKVLRAVVEVKLQAFDLGVALVGFTLERVDFFLRFFA